eukprot:CAMPEP_0197586004 /NCGR_PEP_ID=MMETSP1326-20131121/8132_1 /TAXON_ID=1155430 /ORGANISM="Genus nov. species nov., Strain RCC2288" /LENGTH=152 /DNA_ID=CAMNT_0043150585 /DNA_START=14 /DNA_END=475 /DNA_ORIENTATION=-
MPRMRAMAAASMAAFSVLLTGSLGVMSPTMDSARSWMSASLMQRALSRCGCCAHATIAIRLMRYMWSAMLSGFATPWFTHPVRGVVLSACVRCRKSTARAAGDFSSDEAIFCVAMVEEEEGEEEGQEDEEEEVDEEEARAVRVVDVEEGRCE